MSIVTMEKAQAQLPELIGGLRPGEAVVITQNNLPVAKLVAAPAAQQTLPCEAGCYRKAGFWMAPDFDSPLEDFREYME